MDALSRFRAGGVIPAHPLALTEHKDLDERRQRALTRYYVESGALGVAVGVHTTQFGLHDPALGLLRPVFELAAETAREYPDREPLLVAGVCGPTEQAVHEAQLARELGYQLCLLVPERGSTMSDAELVARGRAVTEVMPTIGFYLQPAVGGRPLDRSFWAQLAELDNLVGIKVAPFDRYATLEVVHGLHQSGRADQIALYTGNDDHIIADLTSTLPGNQEFVGGLLGQWACWTSRAVETLELVRRMRAGDEQARRLLHDLDWPLTDANGALFDVANRFAGCVPGVHEVLRRQGLLANMVFLDDDERLSPGQAEEITRVCRAYPQLTDDDFVATHLDRWLA